MAYGLIYPISAKPLDNHDIVSVHFNLLYPGQPICVASDGAVISQAVHPGYMFDMTHHICIANKENRQAIQKQRCFSCDFKKVQTWYTSVNHETVYHTLARMVSYFLYGRRYALHCVGRNMHVDPSKSESTGCYHMYPGY